MFFTCVAWRRNHRPSACAGSNQSTCAAFVGPHLLQVPDRRRASPSRSQPHRGSSRSRRCRHARPASCPARSPCPRRCSPRRPADRSCRTPGTARPSASPQRSLGTATTVLPIAIAGSTSDSNPSSGASSGHRIADRPDGFLHRQRHHPQRRVVHRAFVLVAPRRIAERPLHAVVELDRRLLRPDKRRQLRARSPRAAAPCSRR